MSQYRVVVGAGLRASSESSSNQEFTIEAERIVLPVAGIGSYQFLDKQDRIVGLVPQSSIVVQISNIVKTEAQLNAS